MTRIRPAWVALARIGLWFVQLVLTGLVFRGLWPVSSQDLRTWEVGVVGASVVLGGCCWGNCRERCIGARGATRVPAPR